MPTTGSRGALAFWALGAVALGALLGLAGWDPFEHVSPATRWSAWVQHEADLRSAALRICWSDPIEMGMSRPITAGFLGSVPVDLVVGPQGGLYDVEVASLAGSATDACVRSRLEAAGPLPRPPADRGAVRVTIPIDLAGGKSFTAAQPTVTGPLAAEVVRQVMELHRDELVRCYRAGLDEKPSLDGKVEVIFWIRPDGTVDLARVTESTTHDPQLDDCVLRAARGWNFPAEGDRPTFVRFAYNFTPTGW